MKGKNNEGSQNDEKTMKENDNMRKDNEGKRQ